MAGRELACCVCCCLGCSAVTRTPLPSLDLISLWKCHLLFPRTGQAPAHCCRCWACLFEAPEKLLITPDCWDPAELWLDPVLGLCRTQTSSRLLGPCRTQTSARVFGPCRVLASSRVSGPCTAVFWVSTGRLPVVGRGRVGTEHQASQGSPLVALGWGWGLETGLLA